MGWKSTSSKGPPSILHPPSSSEEEIEAQRASVLALYQQPAKKAGLEPWVPGSNPSIVPRSPGCLIAPSFAPFLLHGFPNAKEESRLTALRDGSEQKPGNLFPKRGTVF